MHISCYTQVSSYVQVSYMCMCACIVKVHVQVCRRHAYAYMYNMYFSIKCTLIYITYYHNTVGELVCLVLSINVVAETRLSGINIRYI